jgi:hypothetical protein
LGQFNSGPGEQCDEHIELASGLIKPVNAVTFNKASISIQPKTAAYAFTTLLPPWTSHQAERGRGRKKEELIRFIFPAGSE